MKNNELYNYTLNEIYFELNEILPKCVKKIRNDLINIESDPLYSDELFYSIFISHTTINKIDYYIDKLRNMIGSSSLEKNNKLLRKIQNKIIIVENNNFSIVKNMYKNL